MLDIFYCEQYHRDKTRVFSKIGIAVLNRFNMVEQIAKYKKKLSAINT
ncbi:hypothetical protein IFVP69_C1150340 [Vibrio parahaemolyticus]